MAGDVYSISGKLEARKRKGWVDWTLDARNLPVVVFVLAAGLAGAAALGVSRWSLLGGECGLRRLVDAPCPLCGGTRAFAALGAFNVEAAFRLNPLVAAGFIVAALWAALWVWDKVTGADWAERARRVASTWTVRGMILALVLLNWIYVWRALPH